MVPIILDGENAWEYYHRNGRPFFRELYAGIQADPRMEAITVREAFLKMKPEPLLNIFPGSWINANFDIWIGAEEDNKSWRLLSEARQAFDAAKDLSEAQRSLAMEEIMIAEGSDWNWWYGPENHSDNREEFDQIYREHLANVYRALGQPAPPELSQPILKSGRQDTNSLPTGPVGGDNGWSRAGVYTVDGRGGAMQGKRALLGEVRYGSDGQSIHLQVEFAEDKSQLEGLEIQVHPEIGTAQLAVIRSAQGGQPVILAGDPNGVSATASSPLEIAVKAEDGLNGIRLSFWQNGLPIRSVPEEGSFNAG